MNSNTHNPDLESAEFVDLNLEAINELATFAQIYQGFTLAFAEVNFSLDIQVLLKALKNHPRCQDVQFVVIEIADPELEFVLSELKEGLQQTTIEPDKKIVIVVLGLERAIGFVETQKTPEVLENLNFARNVFTEQLPYPVIFVLPDYALTRLARGARDFWAWASAVIAFRSGRKTIEQAHRQVFEPRRLFGSDTKPVKQERIDTLLRLLTQYQPTLGKPDAEIAPLRLNILEELAAAYFSLIDVQTAQKFYKKALALAQSLGNQWAQANAVLGLGKTLAFFDKHTEALNHFEQALHLYKAVDDRLGEANTLKEIGDGFQFLSKNQEALSKYNKALRLYIEVEHHGGEANTLRAIGDTLHFLRKSQEALNCYSEALKLYTVLEDLLGEANTFRSIGHVLQFLNQDQEALNNYNKALMLYQRLGHRLGEANTLQVIGNIFHFKQSQEALKHYQDALKIYTEVGDCLGKANTLRAIGDISLFLDQQQDALEHYNEALNLFKAIGNRLGEANTLHSIGDFFLKKQDLDEESFNQGWEMLNAAYSLYWDIGDQYSQARILLISIAPIALRMGQRGEAISAITQAAKLAAEINYEPFQKRAEDWLKSLQQQEA
jgi:tetratricopeptide (TPR) repeat protein